MSVQLAFGKYCRETGSLRFLIFSKLRIFDELQYSRRDSRSEKAKDSSGKSFAILISESISKAQRVRLPPPPRHPLYWSLSYRCRIHDVSSPINCANIAEEMIRNSLTSIQSSCSIRGYLLLSALDDVLESTPISTIMSRSIIRYVNAVHCYRYCAHMSV